MTTAIVEGKHVEVLASGKDDGSDVYMVVADGTFAGLVIAHSESFAEACPMNDYCYGRDSKDEAVETVVRKFFGGI